VSKSAFRAPEESEFWAKSEHMGDRARAHLWRPRRGKFARSRCGMLFQTSGLIVAGERTTRCKRCSHDG